MLVLRRIALALILLLFAFPQSMYAQESSLAEQLRTMARIAHEGVEAAEQNDSALARSTYTEIHERWETFEDDVRAADATGYIELEAALDTIKDAVNAPSFNAKSVERAYEHLQQEATEVASRIAGGTATAATVSQPADLVRELDAAQQALRTGNVAVAQTHMNNAALAWPAIEGTIAAKSQDDYTTIERELGRALAALEAQPADTASATQSIALLQQRFVPYVQIQSYTAFDAAAIILREGLEALLIIVALLAFLRRSGNADKRGWIWAGGVLGIVASIGVAFILQAIFSQAAAGTNRELLEGITSLLAAAMLFYVSYWLHSKSNLAGWRRYIDERTGKALANGSLAGLAVLSFLAVFREGAETAVFYLGMAPSISTSNLLLGMGLGVVILVVAAMLMLLAGVRLPLRLFFRIASLLVYYLGFKFIGVGIHALQVANILPASPVHFIPDIPFLGVYPTWETIIPQLALLVLAVGLVIYLAAHERRAQSRSMVAG